MLIRLEIQGTPMTGKRFLSRRGVLRMEGLIPTVQLYKSHYQLPLLLKNIL